MGMFSRNELPADAREIRGNVLEGRSVTFDAEVQPDGRTKATRVAIDYVEGAKCPGVIKSFSHRTGWGFATSSCLSGDVRFMLSDFQPAQVFPPTANLQGALVLLEIASQPDGKMKATQIQFQTAKIAQELTGVQNGAPAGAVALQPSPAIFQPNVVPNAGGGVDWSQIAALLAAHNIQLPANVVLPQGINQQAFLQQAQPQPQRSAPQQGVKRSAGGLVIPPPTVPNLGLAQPPAKKSAVPVTSTGQYMSGTIKSYNPSKGWGLIVTPGMEDKGDVFFMKSNLPQEVRDTEGLAGSSVTYELMTAPNGKYRAQNVTMP